MRSAWFTVAAAAVLTATAGQLANAQTGNVKDLGSLLAGQKNLTTFTSLIQKYPQILLQLPSYQGVTILAPNNDAFDKIPFTVLNEAWANGDEAVIVSVLEYHILQGTRTAAQLVPGTPEFIPTLLTDEAYSNVTGGQRVENVEQAGDVVVFVSGQGSRSTLTQAVSSSSSFSQVSRDINRGTTGGKRPTEREGTNSKAQTLTLQYRISHSREVLFRSSTRSSSRRETCRPTQRTTTSRRSREPYTRARSSNRSQRRATSRSSRHPTRPSKRWARS
ncbi:beta-ig-h3 fasciclin [Phlyctema vagabunda]|uniref:Beta-ig-h3 fasciclin n=1 Tax=Phlyctema vagabunda TaxID=108571 RepID=A0ABR4P688_9HELO